LCFPTYYQNTAMTSEGLAEECKCPKNGAWYNGICPNMRRHILGQKDDEVQNPAAWLYITQWRIEHEKKFPTNDDNWLQCYKRLYDKVASVCPQAVAGLLSPAKIQSMIDPKEEEASAQLPDVICDTDMCAYHVRSAASAADNAGNQSSCCTACGMHLATSASGCQLVVQNEHKQKIAIIQGRFHVKNSCNEACDRGDILFLVCKQGETSIHFRRLATRAAVAATAEVQDKKQEQLEQQFQLPCTIKALSELADGEEGFSVPPGVLLVQTDQQRKNKDTWWYFGTVETSAAKGATMQVAAQPSLICPRKQWIWE
jgi:hypothetical protein